MSKHTPGPWYPIRNSIGSWEVMTLRDADVIDGNPHSYVGYPHGASICTGIGDHTEKRTSGNEEENARLIAAAPDLLSVAYAIDDVADRIDHDPDSSLGQAVAMARAAIAKATGE